MGLSMKEKKALTQVLAKRYRKGSRDQKKRILDEFVKTTGYNRKYAIHLLINWGRTICRHIDGEFVKLKVGRPKKRKRKGRRIYTDATRKALKEIWKFFDYMCGKRLVWLIRTNIELLRHEPEFLIDEDVQRQLEKISASTIDRVLAPARKKLSVKGRTHTKHGPLLKHQIPIRTEFTWDERVPGFFELDTVGHDGGSPTGQCCFTLTMTDVSSGWVELRALRNRAQRWIKENIAEVRGALPFVMKGIDSDNGGEFINHTLMNYCRDNQIEFTRGRPYRKNDNCFVEQKNDIAVRKTVGYYRFDTDEEYEALKDVYLNLCPLINYYYPSVKITGKERIGAKVKKTYDTPKTPVQRLLESPNLDAVTKAMLRTRIKKIHICKQKKLVDQAVARLLRLYEKKNQLKLF